MGMQQDGNSQGKNNTIWDDYYRQYQADALIPGVKYPNEDLVTFLSDVRRCGAWPKDRRPQALELGFGTVANMRMMGDLGCDVLGLEVSPDAVSRAERAIEQMRLGDHLKVGCFTGPEIPCPDASYDILVGLQCVYYNIDQEAFARECARVLRPGGVLFFSLFTPDSGYMSYIDGEPGGVVRFRDDHRNKRLIGLNLFLFRDEAHLEEVYGKYFDVHVGRIETNTHPDFHSWFFLRAQKKGGDETARVVMPVAVPEQGGQPGLEPEPANAEELTRMNFEAWNAYMRAIPRSGPLQGHRYPDERLVQFLATRQRRRSEHFFTTAVGKEEEMAHVRRLRALEINFLNPVMQEAMLTFGYEPVGVSWPEAVERGREGLEYLGIADKVEHREWDGVRLPFEDASFDSVVSTKAAYYQLDQQRFVEEVARTVKPGGEIFFYYLSPRMAYHKYMTHVEGNVYRFSEGHPDQGLVGMHVFYAGEDALRALWEPYFDVEVKFVDRSAFRFFLSFYIVRGRRKE